MNEATLKILARIKKMLALAADSAATEGERDNALRMANATMAKYNVSQSQVDLADTSNDPRIHVWLDFDGSVTDWQLRAADGVATLFFSKVFRKPLEGGGAQLVFVGKGVNVTTAQYMTEYVINSIKKESEKACKEYFGGFKLDALLGLDTGETPEATKNVWRESFCVGAALAVQKRCISMAKDSQTTDVHGPGTAIVLLGAYTREQAENMSYIKQVLLIQLQSSRSTMRHLARGAADTGSSYGSRLNLNRQVGNSGSGTKQIGVKK